MANSETRRNLNVMNQNADQLRGCGAQVEDQLGQAEIQRDRAQDQRAQADQRRREHEQQFLLWQIITAFRDIVCHDDVVRGMPEDIRTRINAGTEGNRQIRRRTALDNWLIEIINGGNDRTHPFYTYEHGFQVVILPFRV